MLEEETELDLTTIFPGDSEMAALMRGFDWSHSPLGSPQRWPQSLKTTVRILLTSRFAMWMGWGPELVFLYNDAYGAMTLGHKHPWAMGKRAQQVWAEIWTDLAPRVDAVLRTGVATWDEDLRLFLERSGYTEETYHTFSYSPLTDDGGTVAGMLCVVTEETERVIGERRLNTLRELGANLSTATSEEEAIQAVQTVLEQNRYDLPFTLLYLYDAQHDVARLAGAAGATAGNEIAPATISLSDEAAVWPASGLSQATTLSVAALDGQFSELPVGAWDRPPRTALLVPLARSGQQNPVGFLVAAINPYRQLDAAYTGFVDLVAGQIAGSLASARAFEEETRRARALAELDRAKTEFFSNVSHEFRTPLTLMLGPAEEALADPETLPRHRDRLEVVHRNALRLSKLVNNLLDFSRIEADRIHASYQPVDLAAVTAEIASVFRAAVEKADLDYQLDCAQLSRAAYIDRDMWEKVVLNLISNALKHTFEGEIAVRLYEQNEHAVLEVADTGVGIPVDQLPRIFERFHRVPNARSRTHEGTGIGLALVRELVRMHSGTVTASSRVGSGSVFRVEIPLGSAHLPQDRVVQTEPRSTDRTAAAFVSEAARWTPEPEPRITGNGAAAPGQSSARLLIADDNSDMREYVARLLEEEGWQVTRVADGLAALHAMRQQRPDLVISDIMMPKLDGVSLIKEIRDDAELQTTPVILLSARAGEEARVHGLDSGADDYLVKPFAARELTARVEAQLRMARLRAEAQRQLTESEVRFRNMADHAPVMLWVTERDGSCSFRNREWYAFTGQTEADSLGVGWLKAVHPADVERIRLVFVSANASAQAFRLEYRLRRKDGTYRRAIDAAAPRFDKTGEFLGYIGSVVDIEERALLLDAERDARNAAERANRAKAEFLAAMSHELRTPLNAIAGYVDLLEAGVYGPLTEAQLAALARVGLSERHLLALINDVLNFAKIEAGKLEYRLTDVNVSEVIEAVRPLIEVQVTNKKLTFTADALANVYARADGDKVRQILLNLLSNAIKFTPAGGRISVDVTDDGQRSHDYIMVRVSDTGIGIPHDRQIEIFDPFVQIHRSTDRPVEGTGLGLSISRTLARGMGGDLQVLSEPGTGSTFILALRRAPQS